MSNRPQSNQQSSTLTFIANPLYVFLGSASLVMGLGSLVLILIWLAIGQSQSVRVANKHSDSHAVAESESLAQEVDELANNSGVNTTPVGDNTGDVSGTTSPEDQQVAASTSSSDGQAGASDNPFAGEPFAPFFKLSLPQKEFTDEDRRTYVDDKYVPCFSYAPEFGTLAIVGPWKREVGFLTNDAIENGGGKESVKLVKLSGDVIGVDYKPRPNGGKFVVSYGNPSGVAFIDAQTLEFLKKIPLPDENGAYATCPKDPQVDFAFAFVNRGSSYQINVDTMEIVKTWPSSTGAGHATYDGTWVVRNWRGPISVELADQRGWSHVEHGVTKYDHASPTPFVDPLGRFVALRNEIYSSDFAHQLGEFATIPEAVSVDNSWMFGIFQTELILASLNDGKTIKRFALPTPWIPLDGIADHHRNPRGIENHLRRILSSRGGNGRFSNWSDVFRCKLIADDVRKRLLIAGPDLLSIPYAAFDLPPEPRLLLDKTPLARGTIGDVIEFDIPVGAEDATIELLDARGATIQGHQFRWEPTAGQSGKQTFVAKIKKGNATHLTRWDVHVERRTTDTLPVDFFVDGISAANDESLIAIHGHRPTTERPDDEVRARNAASEIAVFDTRSKELVASKSVAFPVNQLEICRNELLFSEPNDSGGSKVTRLRLSDLNFAGQADAARGRMVSIGGKVVGFVDSDRWTYCTLPDLTPIKLNGTTHAVSDALAGRRVAEGWTFDGVLWDPEMKTRRLIYRSEPFASLGRGLTSPTFGYTKSQQIYQGFVCDLPKTIKVQRNDWRDKTNYDSFHLPANIALEISNGSCDLVFRSLVNDLELHRILLMPRPKYLSSDSRMQDIAYTKDSIYVVCAGKVFVVDAKPLYALMPRPFHIAPVQSTMVLNGRSPKVRYDAPGATSFKLELAGFKGGEDVIMESDDGQFTIDMSHIDEIAADQWKMIMAVRGQGNDPKARLQNYLGRVSDAYQRITSRKPSGVPVAVTAFVSATGPDLATDVLSHIYLIDIPQAAIRKTVPVAVAE
ncbi:MAG: hypothetical protein KDB00_19835 [Planctomycetales bacterium]|nr:hypothetical protein [Planctomycetales bacterium]